MRILKKYLCTGVLLGTILLAGCSANKESEEQVTEDIKGQTVEIVTSRDTDKEEVVSVTLLELTQEKKED